MSVVLLKTDSVNRCPRHILGASHYTPDGGCLCVKPGQLTVKQKETEALGLACPVCGVAAGKPCMNQNSTRKVLLMKHPHPERMRLIDPHFTGNFRKYRPWRIRQVYGAK